MPARPRRHLSRRQKQPGEFPAQARDQNQFVNGVSLASSKVAAFFFFWLLLRALSEFTGVAYFVGERVENKGIESYRFYLDGNKL